MLGQQLFAKDFLISIRVKFFKKCAHCLCHLLIDEVFEFRIYSLQFALRISTFFCDTTLSGDYRTVGLTVHESSIVFGQFEFLRLFRLKESIGNELMSVLI